jgi:glyoxylase-like metal-dependent hydrolase (beta-lactamase superfamily II)
MCSSSRRPPGRAYAQRCLELIRATAPGKPIRYAVASHFHFDHIAGVRTYVAEGIPILTTSDAKGVLEQSVASVRTMHPDELSLKPAKPVIDVASGPMVFSDASQRAEIYDFGPAPHVGQLLVTYFPQEKLLFVADLFDVLTTKLPIAGVDGVAMAQKIDELGLDVERIIPVHGVPATMDDLRRGLAIRAKYVH